MSYYYMIHLIDEQGHVIAKREYHNVPRIGEKFVTGAARYEILDVTWKDSAAPIDVLIREIIDRQVLDEIPTSLPG